MRKFLVIAAALALAGCSTVGAALTGGVSNPVTPKAALELHTAFVATVVVPAADYAKLPRCGANPAPCSSQPVVNKLRVYINGIDPTLKQLDQWALGNTKLDGPALYTLAVNAIAAAQAFEASNGVH